MIRAIVFDCFGVFFADPVFEYVLDPNSPPAIASELDRMDDASARGEITKPEFVRRASELLGQSEDVVEQRFFHSAQRNEKLIEYSQELRKKFKIALLSNIGTDMMDGFFMPTDLEVLFDTYILSGELKIAKPDPRIFMAICERLGVEPQDAVMIDDVKEYCEGAKAVGMQAIQYRNFEQFQSELQDLI